MRLFITVVIAFLAHTQWVCTESTSEIVESATVSAPFDGNSENSTPIFSTLQESNPTEVPESGDVRQEVQPTAAESLNKLIDLENPLQVLHFIFC